MDNKFIWALVAIAVIVVLWLVFTTCNAQVPATPTGLTVLAPSPNTATVSWTASPSPVTGYKIYRFTNDDGNSNSFDLGKATEVVTVGLVSSTSFGSLRERRQFFRIVSMNGCAASPPSAAVGVAVDCGSVAPTVADLGTTLDTANPKTFVEFNRIPDAIGYFVTITDSSVPTSYTFNILDSTIVGTKAHITFVAPIATGNGNVDIGIYTKCANFGLYSTPF